MEKEQIAKLNQLIHEYKKNVQAGWHLTTPDIEDAMNTAYEREEIHLALKALSVENVFIDMDELKEIDKTWQNQILGYIKLGEVKEPFYPRLNEPSRKWWMHIESMDSLSNKDLTTL